MVPSAFDKMNRRVVCVLSTTRGMQFLLRIERSGVAGQTALTVEIDGPGVSITISQFHRHWRNADFDLGSLLVVAGMSTSQLNPFSRTSSLTITVLLIHKNDSCWCGAPI